jgi:hypothetical protein
MNFFKILKQGCFWKFCTWKVDAAPLLKEKASPNAKIAIKQKLSENIKKLENIKLKMSNQKQEEDAKRLKLAHDLYYLFTTRIF